MKSRVLLVEGKGKLRTEPDQAIVYCSFSVFDPSYRNANTELNRLVSLLREQVEALGFKRSDLKTRSFHVQRETARQPQEYHPRFVGFKAVTSLELHLPLDRELVNRVVEAFEQSGANPEVEVAFSVLDPQRLRNRLLAAAVENARAKAESMAEAAGVKLGPILEIRHTNGEGGSVPAVTGSSPVPTSMAPQSDSGEFFAQDSVLVSWEIE